LAGITDGVAEVSEYKVDGGVYKHGVGVGSLQSSKWLREANTIVIPYESTFLYTFKLKGTE